MPASSAGGSSARFSSAAIGAVAGATAWVSLGVLALTDPAAMTRVGALPPWSWLAGLAVAGALGGWLWLWRVPSRAPLGVLAVLWLPWLPRPVPGVFLMWDGPIEGAVWGAALAGLAWVTAASRSWGPPAWPARRAMVVAGLGTALVYLGAWRIDRARVPAGDEPHYLVITQSLLNDGDLRIENNHQADQYLAYYDGALRPDFRRRGTDRQIYSIHAPGLSVVVLPAFAIAGYPGAVVTVLALAGLALALVWGAAWQLTGSESAAWFAWAAVTASAPLVLHGFTIYPDTAGTAAVMAGVLALVTLERGGGAWRDRGWLAVGAGLACLPWLHTRFVIVAAVLGAVLALRLWSAAARRALAALLIVPSISALAWFAFFWVIYGTPNPIAPYGAREGGLLEVPRGVAGLLLDQEFGLAAHAPILVTALAALVPLARRHRRLAIELAAIVVPYLFAVGTYPMWWGGYSAPARFLVVVLPVLGVPLAFAWAASGSALRTALVGLAGVSAAIAIATVVHDRGAFMYNNRDGHGLLLDWLSPTVDLTLGAPSVHRDGPGVAVLDGAVWLAALALAGALSALVSRAGHRIGALAWALAAPLAAMAAIPAVAAGRERPLLTASTSQTGLLGRWNPARLPLAVQLAPTRAVAVGDLPRRLSLVTSTRVPARRDAPLLQVPEVPAGDYDVFVNGDAPLSGTLVVRVGRQSYPMATWPLAGRPPGFGGLDLHLPLDTHSVTIDGDAEARGRVRDVSLKPRRLDPGAHPWALRSARYGAVVLYCLDDYTYLEPQAAWIRGERTGRMVVSVDPGGAPVLALRAGPVANVVTVTAGGWTQTVSLAADQAAQLPLPAEALAPAVLAITSATGFRPSEQPGSAVHDVRWLGVYLTWPEAAAPR